MLVKKKDLNMGSMFKPVTTTEDFGSTTIREKFVDGNNDDDDLNFGLVKTQNVEPIMDAVKSMSDHVSKGKNDRKSMRLKGTVPLIFAIKWAKESGTRLYTREWSVYASKKLDEAEFSNFKIKRKT